MHICTHVADLLNCILSTDAHTTSRHRTAARWIDVFLFKDSFATQCKQLICPLSFRSVTRSRRNKNTAQPLPQQRTHRAWVVDETQSQDGIQRLSNAKERALYTGGCACHESFVDAALFRRFASVPSTDPLAIGTRKRSPTEHGTTWASC